MRFINFDPATENPRSELEGKIQETNREIERINERSRQGFISQRLGEYSKCLVIIDYLATEAETYAKFRCVDNADHTLSIMKHWLDCVATEVLKDRDEHQELYNFAKQRYDDTLTKCSQLLGLAA